MPYIGMMRHEGIDSEQEEGNMVIWSKNQAVFKR